MTGFSIGTLPRIARGEGSYLFDDSGQRYLDGSGGPAVFSLGHGNAEVNAAIGRQLAKVAFGYRHLFASSALEELTQLILKRTGGHFKDALFHCSGSEANESALKVALQHHVACGRTQKRRFIARHRSWHGNTLGALSVSDFSARRRSYQGSLLEVAFVSAANAYRPPSGVSEQMLPAHLAAELEHSIQSIGPDNVAAFVFEPIVGAAGGVVPAPAGYAQLVQAVCRQHDVLVIADEVMCGSGRSGTWRALEFDAMVPDIMTVAKGLGGGYIPLSAALISAAVAAPIHAEHGGYQTGHTFTGHTTACAAALAVQKIIERDGLIERVRARGLELRSTLAERLARFDEVGDVRGRGYFIGIELVADRASRRPFPRQRALSARVGRAALADGLICYPCAGNVDGTDGDTIIIAPPYNIRDAELEELVTKLERAIGAALSQAAP